MCLKPSYTIEEVRQILVDASCEYLDDVYHNKSKLFNYRCFCGNLARTNLTKFLDGRRCKKCANNKKKKCSFSEVQKIFLEQGCVLLSTEYIGCHTRLIYICSCGKQDSVRLFDFISGKRCIFCQEKKLGRRVRVYTFEEVKDFFDKAGCVFLDDFYINAHNKINFICSCGAKAKKCLYDFLRGGRCSNCWHDRSADGQRGEKSSMYNPDRELIKLKSKINDKCKHMVQNCLKITKKNKSRKTEELLGYTRTDLLNRIQNHSNWNYVKTTNWHLDHIFPISAFVEYNILDLKMINALDNLQPLLAKDNLSKNDKYDYQEFIKYLTNKYGTEVLDQYPLLENNVCVV